MKMYPYFDLRYLDLRYLAMHRLSQLPGWVESTSVNASQIFPVSVVRLCRIDQDDFDQLLKI
jgi:hypothetical protein